MGLQLPHHQSAIWDPHISESLRHAMMTDNDQAIEDALNAISGLRYSTQVVAASNSLHPNAADFVCTGTNDDQTVQAAVNAILAGPATVGTVLLMEGTYNWGGTGIVSSTGRAVGVRGVGSGPYTNNPTTIINLPSTNTSGAFSNMAFVQNITVTGGGAGMTNSVIGGICGEVSGCFFNMQVANTSGFNVAIVSITDASGVGARVHDNVIVVPSSVMGVIVTDQGHLVYANRFRLLGTPTAAIDISNGSDSLIHHNIILGTPTSVTAAIRAAGTSTCDHVMIDHNIINVTAGAAGDGIQVGASGFAATNVSLRGNQVRKNGSMRNGVNIGANSTGALVVHNDLRLSGTTNSLLDGGVGTFKNMDGSANNWNLL